MKLVTQTPLSVPELVRCFENNVHDVSSADKVISAIYTEESDNQARLNNASILSDHRHDVLEATTKSLFDTPGHFGTRIDTSPESFIAFWALDFTTVL